MKMLPFLLLFSLLLLSSCIVKVNLEETAWATQSIMAADKPEPMTSDKTYVLNFTDKGQINLKLDINRCVSRFGSPSANRINIEPFACTKACCDSKFATQLISLLPEMTNYHVKDNQLTLESPLGKIVFTKTTPVAED